MRHKAARGLGRHFRPPEYNGAFADSAGMLRPNMKNAGVVVLLAALLLLVIGCANSTATPMPALTPTAMPMPTPAPTATAIPAPTATAMPVPTLALTPTAMPAPTATPTPSPCSNGVAVAEPENNPGLVNDCGALLRARDTLAGDALLNWSADVPIRQWDGVAVGGAPARVQKLDLESWALTGEIPSELGNLTGLVELNLSLTQLTGEIPPELGRLTNLKTLTLDGNRLTGCVPAQ